MPASIMIKIFERATLNASNKEIKGLNLTF